MLKESTEVVILWEEMKWWRALKQKLGIRSFANELGWDILKNRLPILVVNKDKE